MRDEGLIRIRYLRPPDREQIFEQQLVSREPDGVVTLLESAAVSRATVVGGVTVLEPGSPIVWFSFPEARHDIGRFHTRDGRFTGLYANILTPVLGLAVSDWTTTDLFLDVWLPGGAPPAVILDENELDDALAQGWLDPTLAALARAEAGRLVDAAGRGSWPPRMVREWPLARARDAVRHLHRRDV